MATKKQIMESLDKILLPGTERSLTQMNLIKEVKINAGAVEITLTAAALSSDIQAWLKNVIFNSVGSVKGVTKVDVNFVDGVPKDLNQIKHVVAVMSGKGGVGKSLVTSLAAIALQRQGYAVGILDADITGPSIPKMFGIIDRPGGSDNGILPVSSKSGIEIMSINLLLPDEGDAVIWRGPLIGKAITQFWEEVLWGKLDYLLVDLPPGTADAPLTVLQSLPVSGIVIVSTPQDLTNMVVKKAVNMAQHMQKPIIGVVENMSYLYVAEIDKKIELFGKSRGEDMARIANAPLLGKLPIDPELAKLCDEGNIESYKSPVLHDFEQKVKQVFPDANNQPVKQ
jgi:hydrogenase maturation protease